jgi:hypothetical protein
MEMTEQTDAPLRTDPDPFDLPATGSRVSRIMVRNAALAYRAEPVWVPLVASAWPRPTRVYSLEDDELDIRRLRQVATTRLFTDTAVARLFRSYLTVVSRKFLESTSPFSTVTEAPAQTQGSEEPVLVPEILLRLRAHFSLNTSELARVLDVERPTIYAWSKEDVTVRKQHRARLLALDRILRFWTRLSRQPLGRLKDATVGDRTFLELLADTSISENTVCEALRDLATRPSVEEWHVQQQSIAKLARERSWTKVSPERVEQTLRSLRKTRQSA